MICPDTSQLKTLVPFSWDEACGFDEAQRLMGVRRRCASERGARYGLARRFPRQTLFSRVAIAMFMDGNFPSLEKYIHGDRTSQDVLNYYRRLSLPLPHVPAEG